MIGPTHTRPRDRFWVINGCISILAVSTVTALIVVSDSYIPILILGPIVSIIVTTGMYRQDICHVKGCGNYNWAGRLYKFTCIRHKCKHGNCNNFVLQPNSICLNHVCHKLSCMDPITTPGKTFCDRHACLSSSCKKRCHPGLRVCLDHKCELCDGYGIHSILVDGNSGSRLLCNDHLPCSTENCVDTRVSGLDVCETCNELEIMSEPPPTYSKSKI